MDLAPADEKRLAQAIEDLKSKPGVRGVSSRNGQIYIRPAGPTARETLKRSYTSGYGGFDVFVEQAHERKPVRRKGILRVRAEVKRHDP